MALTKNLHQTQNNLSTLSIAKLGENLNFFVKLIAQFKEWLNRSTPSAVGLDHISYQLNPIDKWFDFYLKAKDRGLKPYWTINHGWITGMYYKDPDGNLIEIFFVINEYDFQNISQTRKTLVISCP